MTTTTKTATNNFKVDTAMNPAEDNTAQVELIKQNGLSFEGFLATNAGLTIEEYRARKAAQQAAKQAEAERREKIFNLKDGIKSAEYKINETSGTLNDIIKNHYRPESDDGSWDEYTAELGDTLATAVSTLNTLKAQLAELEPAIVEENTATKTDEPKNFTANVMPAEDDDTDDELIDEPDPQTVERNKGNYGEFINGEYVRFENHSIAYIDAERKNGYSYNKRNGRKNFYRYGRKIAASKIAEAYMNGERAAEQNKAHHEFFYAHKLEVGNPFKVSFEITTADGQEHFFSRTFETFAEAKALVDEFTATFSEPTQIVIKQNKQNGDWFYSRDTDGTEKFFDAFCKLNATEEDKPTKKATAKVDRLDELKAKKWALMIAIDHSLRGHYVKLESGEFCDASEAGFTTTGIEAGNPIFDKLYFKDDSGAYVEVSEKAIDAFNRLESEHGIVCDAIKAEIARTAVKFEVGKWYASDETYWDGNPCDNRYCVLKRTKKFVTIYDYQNDDWHYIDNYDPDDEIDGEFDCIFRKKIQFDERGEYVDWRDENGELVTLCAKDVTDKPVDEDPDDADNDADDDATEDNVEVEPATDKTPASAEIKKLFSRRKYHERKKTARHTQHRPRRMVHAACRH